MNVEATPRSREQTQREAFQNRHSHRDVRSAGAGLKLGLLAALMLACASSPEPKKQPPGQPPPSWLQSLPYEPQLIYAVGTSGPTFFPQDSLRYAKEDAWAQLSHSLATKVTSITVSISDESGGQWVDSASVIEATSGLSDVVVEFGEIVSTWIDRSGDYSGEAGSTYALARLDLNRLSSVFAALEQKRSEESGGELGGEVDGESRERNPAALPESEDAWEE